MKAAIIEVLLTIGAAILMLLAIAGLLACTAALVITIIMIGICVYHLALKLQAPEQLAQSLTIIIVVLMIGVGCYAFACFRSPKRA